MRRVNTAGHASFGYFVRFLMVLLVIGSLALFASNLIAGQLFSFTSIQSRGSIKKINVGVYWDKNCSSPLSFVDWGNIEPGSGKNITVFIRNEGNEVANLFLTTENWNPSNASSFITLDWNYNGRTLNPLETVEVTLILRVPPNIEEIKNFSFDIIIGVTA